MHAKTLLTGEDNDLQDSSPGQGRYANFFKIGHNAFEFLLDFGQLYAQHGEAQPHTRIVTTPVYAKTLARILQESIERYEQTFGTIPEDDK